MSTYHWIDNKGNFACCMTNNKAHKILIDAHILEHQVKDKDAKPVLTAHNSNTYVTFDTETSWDDTLTDAIQNRTKQFKRR